MSTADAGYPGFLVKNSHFFLIWDAKEESVVCSMWENNVTANYLCILSVRLIVHDNISFNVSITVELVHSSALTNGNINHCDRLYMQCQIGDS